MWPTNSLYNPQNVKTPFMLYSSLHTFFYNQTTIFDCIRSNYEFLEWDDFNLFDFIKVGSFKYWIFLLTDIDMNNNGHQNPSDVASYAITTLYLRQEE